jgi:hypothetical protein
MGNNFFGNLFNLKKTARGKSSPSFLPVLYPAPEFGFEKKYQNVLQAVKKHQIKFPVAQDNEFRLWRAYKNLY